MTDEINRIKAYLKTRNALRPSVGDHIHGVGDGNGGNNVLAVSDIEAVLSRLDEITGLVQAWQKALDAATDDDKFGDALCNAIMATAALRAWPADAADELAPCPFCGEKPLFREYDFENEIFRGHEVGCDACEFWKDAFRTKSDAIAWWNARAVPK